MFQQFDLTTLQKRILVLGMDEREISPAEIYRALNTRDRNIYDRQVTALRNARILLEIRTNPAATGIARRNRISKEEVPRFRVAIPGIATTRSTHRLAPAPPRKMAPPTPRSKIFLDRLPAGFSSDDVRSLAGGVNVGPIQMLAPNRAGKRGAFLFFERLADAEAAMEKFASCEVGGSPIVSKWITRRRDNESAGRARQN